MFFVNINKLFKIFQTEDLFLLNYDSSSKIVYNMNIFHFKTSIIKSEWALCLDQKFVIEHIAIA